MAKRVRRDVFTGQRCRLLGCGSDVPIQFEANSCGSERLSITVDEDRLVAPSRLPFQEGLEEVDRFRPEGGCPLFSTLAHKLHLGWRLQAHGLWAQVERLLNACARIVKQGKQG